MLSSWILIQVPKKKDTDFVSKPQVFLTSRIWHLYDDNLINNSQTLPKRLIVNHTHVFLFSFLKYRFFYTLIKASGLWIYLLLRNVFECPNTSDKLLQFSALYLFNNPSHSIYIQLKIDAICWPCSNTICSFKLTEFWAVINYIALFRNIIYMYYTYVETHLKKHHYTNST